MMLGVHYESRLASMPPNTRIASLPIYAQTWVHVWSGYCTFLFWKLDNCIVVIDLSLCYLMVKTITFSLTTCGYDIPGSYDTEWLQRTRRICSFGSDLCKLQCQQMTHPRESRLLQNPAIQGITRLKETGNEHYCFRTFFFTIHVYGMINFIFCVLVSSENWIESRVLQTAEGIISPETQMAKLPHYFSESTENTVKYLINSLTWMFQTIEKCSTAQTVKCLVGCIAVALKTRKALMVTRDCVWITWRVVSVISSLGNRENWREMLRGTTV